MKRLLRSLLLGAILSALLCVGALATDSNDPGIYNIKTNDGVTITPKKADNSAITDVGGYYANAAIYGIQEAGATGILQVSSDATGLDFPGFRRLDRAKATLPAVIAGMIVGEADQVNVQVNEFILNLLRDGG